MSDNRTTSPNMNLRIPTVGAEAGPLYAIDVNYSMTVIDSHTHNPGNGVQITPSGLNINADLPLNSNNLTLVRSVRFISLDSPPVNALPDIGCIYVSGNELYFNDYSGGHQVQMTSNGSINYNGSGSIVGLPSGTASVAYINSVFVFQSSTTVPAVIDCGPVIVRNTIASSEGMTIYPPPSIAASFDVTFPNLPLSLSVLLMDPTGIISTSVAQYQAFAPSGMVSPYAGASAPVGWLMCNGAAVSRTTYAALFAICSTVYGSGDGTTTFNVPNLIDRAPFGAGSTFSVAQTGGAANPSLASMVTHTHAVVDPGHAHTVGVSGTTNGFGNGAPNMVQNSGSKTSSTATTGISLSSAGSSTTNGNMPPFIGMNYIIKT